MERRHEIGIFRSVGQPRGHPAPVLCEAALTRIEGARRPRLAAAAAFGADRSSTGCSDASVPPRASSLCLGDPGRGLLPEPVSILAAVPPAHRAARMDLRASSHPGSGRDGREDARVLRQITGRATSGSAADGKSTASARSCRGIPDPLGRSRGAHRAVGWASLDPGGTRARSCGGNNLVGRHMPGRRPRIFAVHRRAARQATPKATSSQGSIPLQGVPMAALAPKGTLPSPAGSGAARRRRPRTCRSS
jgi:hypothetical protein